MLRHDMIRQRLEEIRWTELPRAVPLDTSENLPYVYGGNHKEYVRFIHAVRATVLKHHTLTKKDFFEARRMYDASTFFVTDGYYDDAVTSLQVLVSACHELVTDYKQLFQFAGKTREDCYNLKLMDELLDDILTLVECLKIDRNLSTNKHGRASRDPGGDLEENPSGS